MKTALRTFQHYYTDSRAVWVLCGTILLAAVLYVFFTFQTVTNVVERQDLNRELGVLNSEIGELEFAYIHKKNNISLAQADQLNMVQKEEATYISRPALGQRTGTNRL